MRALYLAPGQPPADVDIADDPAAALEDLIDGAYEMIPLHDNPDATMIVNAHAERLNLPANRLANKAAEHYIHGFAASGGRVRGPAVVIGLRDDGDFGDIPDGISERLRGILA